MCIYMLKLRELLINFVFVGLYVYRFDYLVVNVWFIDYDGGIFG